MMKELGSTASGGTLFQTSTGLIHKAGSGAYSGRLAEENVNIQAFGQVKRGRGRPRKDGGVGGPKFSFDAFLTRVKLPAWTGPVTRHCAEKE